ncbi:MAG: signal peptidase [Nocardioidaceae bacterium]|nr:signal peptidase [Nocardioidaceae bacterium]
MSSAVRKPRRLPVWQESILLVIAAMVMAVIVKTFFVQAFYIPSESMEPTMLVNDKILVQKVSYWAGDVKRGDVVVFNDPGGWLTRDESRTATNPIEHALSFVGLYPTGGHLIKRVIGVGGDKIVCCTEKGKLTVNGKVLDEPYLADQTSTRDTPFSISVPRGKLWVMGDNRGDSEASPQHVNQSDGGFLSEKQVVGKAWLRVWPWKRAGFIHSPDTFKGLDR